MTVSEFINKVGFQVDQSTVNAVNSTISDIKSTATKLLGSIGIGISLSALNSVAEEFNQINDRINGIVSAEDDAKEVQQDILEAANACKTSYADMASNVESLVNMNSDLFPIEDATMFAEYVQKIGLAAGYSDSEISSMQSSLQRIVAAGTASSSDITRMLRSTPALAKQLADALGVATDELNTMADAGELTAQTIKDAILGSTDAIDMAFDQLDYSISDALLNIRNQWGFWVDSINSSLQISQTVAKTMVKGFNGIMSVLNTAKDALVSLNEKLGGSNQLFKLLAIVAGAFVAVLAWPKLVAGAQTFINALKSIKNALGLGSIGTMALIALIIVLALIVEDFINFMQGNDSVIGYCFEKAGIDCEEMRQKIVNIWNNLKTFFAGIWDAIKGIFQPALDWIKEKLEDVFGDDLFAGIGNGLEAVITVLERFTEALANNEGLQDTIAKIAVAIVGVVAAVKTISGVTGIVSKFGDAFKKVSDPLSKVSKSTGSSGSSGGIASKITSFFTGFANIKTSTVLKGVANIAIVVAGVTAMAAGIMALAPYMAQLTDAASLIEVLVVIGVVGLLGTALTELASLVGNIPVSTVALGVANIAIALGGMTALSAAIMAIAEPIAQLSSASSIAEILAMITAVGLIGSALAALAGVIGMIPVALVVQGLADIALAIGGFTAIATAYGALASVNGFTDLVSGGLDALSTLANGIGSFVGNLIGGIGEGISDALPAIGENLASFAENLEPFFTICSGADLSGVSAFIDAFASFVLKMTANDLLSFFTGGTDLTSIGEQLTGFATGVGDFFSAVSELPDEGFTKATALFESLSGMGNLIKSGGVAQFFTGETDFEKVSEGLSSLASDGVTSFYNMVAELPDETFTKATSLFESLSGMGNVMKSGGVAQFFTGEADYAKITEALQELASDGVTSFYSMVAGLPEDTFTKAEALFESLSGMGNVMKTGGVAQFFTGTSDYSKISQSLADLAGDGTTAFYNMVAGLPEDTFTKATALFDSLSGMGDVMKSGGVAQFISGSSDYGKVAEALQSLSSGGVPEFFSMVAGLAEDGFTKAVSLFQTLADISEIPLGTIDTSSVDGGALSAFAADVQEFFTSVSTIDTSSISGILSALTDFSAGLQNAANMVDSVFGGIGNTVTSATSEVVSAVQTSWKEVENDTDSSFRQVGTSMESNLTSARSLVVSACNSIKTSMTSAFDGLPTTFANIGVNIMQGLANGISNGASSVVNAMTSAVNQAVQAAKSEAGVNSPSTRFRDEIGQYLPQGVAVGVEENADTASNAVSDMINGLFGNGDSIKEALSTAISGAETLASASVVSPSTAMTAAGGSTDNSRNVSQNVNINNTFNGDKAIQQKAASAMDSSAEDVTASLARGLAYAR